MSPWPHPKDIPLTQNILRIVECLMWKCKFREALWWREALRHGTERIRTERTAENQRDLVLNTALSTENCFTISTMMCLSTKCPLLHRVFMKMSWGNTWKAFTVVTCSKWTTGFVIRTGDAHENQNRGEEFSSVAERLPSMCKACAPFSTGKRKTKCLTLKACYPITLISVFWWAEAGGLPWVKG